MRLQRLRLLPLGVLLSIALLSLTVSTMTGSQYAGPKLLTDGGTATSGTFLRVRSAQELAVPAPTASAGVADEASLMVEEDVTNADPGVDGLVLLRPEAVVPSGDGKAAIELTTGVAWGPVDGELGSTASVRWIRRVDPGATSTSMSAGSTGASEAPASTDTAIPASTPTPTPILPEPTIALDAAAAARATATAQARVPANETVASVNTPTPTQTSTPLPTATRTPTPTSTSTAVPPAPTSTATALPPTATRTTAPPPTATPPAPTATPAQGTRDVYAWPCASTSIWNMPIGSAASYVSAGLQNANGWNGGEMTTDDEFIGLNPGDPLKPLNGTQVHVPPAISWNGSWNGVAAFLSSDGHSVLQGQPLLLSAGGNPAWQYNAPTVDIKGDCILGAHGGSGLSSFGGSLRKGELASSQALHHALKINLYARRFLSCANSGYRWPATRADSYMDCSTYGGAVSQMRMGSLVALRPTENCASYGSMRARKICQALQDYGAYVADDTYWDVHAIDMESGAEFSDGGSFHADLQAMFTRLAVVDNNGPSSIGGGGTPRQPLAPGFSN